MRAEKVLVFVEDRIEQGSDEVFRSHERRLAGSAWQRLTGELPGLSLCARALRVEQSSGEPIEGRVVPLPYYQGAVQSLLSLPKLFFCVWRATDDVQLMVAKAPGVISLVVATVAWARRKPMALQLVGDIEDVMLDGKASLDRKLLAGIARRAMAATVRRAAAVRYPTAATLQRKYPVRKGAVSVFYTDAGVVPTETLPTEQEVVPGRIVAVGSQERRYKGHDVLLHAVAQLRLAGTKASLVLVGRGTHHAELESLSSELGIEDSVTFIEHIDQWPRLAKLLRSAEVFAMPSLTEGLPRVLLEAMSQGVACVGSDAGGIPELLPDSAIVPKGDVSALASTLGRVLGDSTFRQELQRHSLSRSNDYSAAALTSNLQEWQLSLRALLRR